MKIYRINGKVEVSPMSVEQVTYMNGLVDRDIPIAPRQERFKTGDYERKYLYCKMCDALLNDRAKFCHNCGQRVDMENVAIE